MSEPIYETDEHRRIEAEILHDFCSKRNMTFVHEPPFAHTDAKLYINGKIRAIAEVRQRYCEFMEFPDFTMDVLKIDYLREHADHWGVTPLIIIRFKTDLYYRRMNGWEFFRSGNQKHGTRGNIRHVYHIPWGQEWKIS